MPAFRIEAVVFDMDGVLVDTEHLWDDVREELTGEWGGRYTPEAQQAMMGMSSREWSRYLHEVVGLREPPDVINAEVVRRMLARYEVDLPVVPGAVDAVRRLAEAGYRLAVAYLGATELEGIPACVVRLGHFTCAVSHGGWAGDASDRRSVEGSQAPSPASWRRGKLTWRWFPSASSAFDA